MGAMVGVSAAHALQSWRTVMGRRYEAQIDQDGMELQPTLPPVREAAGADSET
jgi:hypothetical protein